MLYRIEMIDNTLVLGMNLCKGCKLLICGTKLLQILLKIDIFVTV